MFWLGESLVTLNRIEDEKDILRKIDAVSPQDIKNLASQIFKTNNLNLSMIGPLNKGEKEEIERCLKI
jgi:predicted Zn-dependent peptidase